jgi:hypothetical protein
VALSEKQRRFVKAYAETASPREAVIRAGYGLKNAASRGKTMLKHPGIAAAIQALTKAPDLVFASKIFTRQELQVLLTKMSADETLDPKHRLRAIELLGKSQGMFVNVTMDITQWSSERLENEAMRILAARGVIEGKLLTPASSSVDGPGTKSKKGSR